MSLVIRHFIRESIRLCEMDLYGPSPLEGDDFESPREKESLVGKRFSFVLDGEPEFQVAAENRTTGELIVVPYPMDNVVFQDPNDNYIVDALEAREQLVDPPAEGEYPSLYSVEVSDGTLINLTAQTFKRNLDAETIVHNSPKLDAAIKQTDGWVHDPVLGLMLAASQAGASSMTNGPGLPLANAFLMKKDWDKLKAPIQKSTEAGITKVAKFQCAKKPAEVAKSLMDVATWNVKAMQSPEWAENAACFYGYANSGKAALLSGIIGGALALLLAPETAGVSILAFLSSVGLATTVQDVLCRVPAIIWAGVTGRKKFMIANVVYLIIVITFESLSKLRGAKVGLQTASITGKEAVKKAGVLEAGSGFLFDTMTNAGVPNITAEVMQQVIEQARKAGGIARGRAIPDDVLAKELFEAIDKSEFWTITKICLTGLALQVIAAFFGDSYAQSCKMDVEGMIDGTMDMQAAMSLDLEMAQHASELRAKYPIR